MALQDINSVIKREEYFHFKIALANDVIFSHQFKQHSLQVITLPCGQNLQADVYQPIQFRTAALIHFPAADIALVH